MNSPWIFRTIQDESEKNHPLYTHHDLRCRIDDLLFFVGMIIYMLMLLFGTHNNEIKLHVQQMPQDVAHRQKKQLQPSLQTNLKPRVQTLQSDKF